MVWFYVLVVLMVVCGWSHTLRGWRPCAGVPHAPLTDTAGPPSPWGGGCLTLVVHGCAGSSAAAAAMLAAFLCVLEAELLEASHERRHGTRLSRIRWTASKRPCECQRSILMHREPAGSVGVSGFPIFAGAQSCFQKFETKETAAKGGDNYG